MKIFKFIKEYFKHYLENYNWRKDLVIILFSTCATISLFKVVELVFFTENSEVMERPKIKPKFTHEKLQ